MVTQDSLFGSHMLQNTKIGLYYTVYARIYWAICVNNKNTEILNKCSFFHS